MFRRTSPPWNLANGERLTRLDISLPFSRLDDHATPNTWDTDVAELLLHLQVLQHFAARNTVAGML